VFYGLAWIDLTGWGCYRPSDPLLSKFFIKRLIEKILDSLQWLTQFAYFKPFKPKLVSPIFNIQDYAKCENLCYRWNKEICHIIG
jgi:hypothetical protein